jgi:uncharacterized membrane protein
MDRFHHQFDPRMGDGGWHGVVAWLIPVLFLLVLAGLVIFIVLRLAGQRQPALAPAPAGWFPTRTSRADQALDHVRLRYARGEISREEFLQTSADLGAAAPETWREPEPPDES